jgi:hypothetical protein
MKRIISTLTVIVAILLIGCTGKQGPTGPQGEQGEPGPGSRIVYQSTTAIPTEALYTVLCPEINTGDMPLVSVYVSVPGSDFWVELPVYIAADQTSEQVHTSRTAR